MASLQSVDGYERADTQASAVALEGTTTITA